MTTRYFLPAIGIVLVGLLLLQARRAGGLRGSSPEKPPSVPASTRVKAEGRLTSYPGAEVMVGTDVGGTVRRLLVQEKSRVRKGQLMVELDGSVERAGLAEARARVVEAEADIRLGASNLERTRRLVATQASTPQALDTASHDHEAALARRELAVATVRRLDAAVSKTRIVAPIDGVVLERRVEIGEAVSPGARLFSLANLGRTRVEAEVDEYDIGRVKLGAEVLISAEAYPGARWKGRVEEIPDAVVARRLKPQDPARPSDTRVLLVKVALAEPTPLKLGQRVEVEVAGR